jgi:signal transduction histidine kinase
VVDAARQALQVIRREGAARIVMPDDSGEAPRRGDSLRYPIEAEGVRFGWIAVDPAETGSLEHDTDEYLRIVANETGTLLRAIDLYDELAEGAVRDERAQLARELHDGLAQDLAVLRLRLSSGCTEAEAAALADRALSEARYAITILRGGTAAPSDFVAALRRQTDDLSDRYGFPVILEEPEPLSDVPASVQVALLRIIREAITNAGKHAEATRVAIRLMERAGRLEAEIVDDGRGFDVSAPPAPGKYGLQGMRERAALLGGDVDIASRFGRGTTVRAWFPLSDALSPEGAEPRLGRLGLSTPASIGSEEMQ